MPKSPLHTRPCLENWHGSKNWTALRSLGHSSTKTPSSLSPIRCTCSIQGREEFADVFHGATLGPSKLILLRKVSWSRFGPTCGAKNCHPIKWKQKERLPRKRDP